MARDKQTVSITVVKARKYDRSETVVVSYMEGDDPVFISQDGMYFESEARHLKKWADTHNVELTIKEIQVTI